MEMDIKHTGEEQARKENYSLRENTHPFQTNITLQVIRSLIHRQNAKDAKEVFFSGPSLFVQAN